MLGISNATPCSLTLENCNEDHLRRCPDIRGCPVDRASLQSGVRVNADLLAAIERGRRLNEIADAEFEEVQLRRHDRCRAERIADGILAWASDMAGDQS
jgi:hypothetical protein